MAEEIETVRASHIELYPPDMFCIVEYYLTEDDAMTAISSLAAAVEDIYRRKNNNTSEEEAVKFKAQHQISYYR